MAPTTTAPENEATPISDAEVDAAVSADVDAEFGRLLAEREEDAAPARPTFEPLEDARAPWGFQDVILAGSFFLLSGATFALVVIAAFSE